MHTSIHLLEGQISQCKLVKQNVVYYFSGKNMSINVKKMPSITVYDMHYLAVSGKKNQR